MRATINGIAMNYEVHGEGAPVLFVHGFPLSGEMWKASAAELKSTYKVIVPDLRGHGGSEATKEASMADYANDLAGLLNHLKETRPAVVVGLSMGGYVAMEFYRRHRKHVRALALVDTRAEADTPEGAKGRKETAEKVLKDGSKVVADAMVGKLFAPDVAAGLKEKWQATMAGTPPQGVAAALHAMAGRIDSTSTLQSIEVPVLIVVGDKDVITPPELAQKMNAAAKGSRLEVIAGAGHMAPVEKPEVFNPILKKFLAEVTK